VTDYSAEPPLPPHPDRIPVSDADRRGVVDPMSSTLNRVAGSGDPVSPEACGRRVAVFDGRVRYDLRSEFKRIEMVKAEKGYQGPAVVCAVYFAPISGYVPDRPVIKYLIELRDAEVWLAPISGTRVSGAVPFRDSDPGRPGHPAGDGICLGPDAACCCFREDAVSAGAVPAAVSPLSTGNPSLTPRRSVIHGLVNLWGAKATRKKTRCTPHMVVSDGSCPICRGERSRTGPESPIRPRFVPDSFHILSTGLSSVAL